MFSLDVKRMQEKKQREQGWIGKKSTDDSPRTKEHRMQRIYGKSTDDMYDDYNQRVSEWATTTAEKSPEWKGSYGQLTTNISNPMVWPRDQSKEIGSQFIDNGKYVAHGQYRGGGECLQQPTPLEPRKEVFDHGEYTNPIDSPFRRRAKAKEIQGPLRYNTIVREYPEKPQDFDSTWTEPKPLPQWRFPDPSKWCDGEFGVTFKSKDSMTALFEGVANQKHSPTIAASEKCHPLTRAPLVRSKLVSRAASAPIPHTKLYMNSILSVNTNASKQVLQELAPRRLQLKSPAKVLSPGTSASLQTVRPR